MKNDVGVQRLGVSVLLINFKTFQRLFVNFKHYKFNFQHEAK